MSYGGYRGLGADSADETGRARTTIHQSDHGQPWLMIGVQSSEYQQLRNKMSALGFPTGLMADGHASASVGTGLGLFAAWLRFGRKQQWWLSELVRDEVLTDSLIVDWGRRLRVHEQLYAAIIAGHTSGKTEPWTASSDGYVHLLGGSSQGQRDALIDRIVGRLLAGAYLPPPLGATETVAQRTDSYFGANNEAVNGSAGLFLGDRNAQRGGYTGLRLAANDLRLQGNWPTGIDFGATMGRELRIHDALLKALFSGTALPGEVRLVRQRITARLTMKRIIGGFPKVGGR